MWWICALWRRKTCLISALRFSTSGSFTPIYCNRGEKGAGEYNRGNYKDDELDALAAASSKVCSGSMFEPPQPSMYIEVSSFSVFGK